MKLLDAVKKAIGIDTTASGANGVYISRPVLNGQDWYDWAVKWNVPSPLAAADMHVTVLYSTTDVKMVPQLAGYTVSTNGANYGSAGVFCFFGPDNECLVFAWDDYLLWERNWQLQQNGGVTTWPTYRPHMTISNDANGFDLPDAALADAPQYISLGGEQRASLNTDPDLADTANDSDDEDEEDDNSMVIVIQLAATEAAKTLNDNLSNPKVTGVDRTALRDIAAQKPITKSVARRIAKAEWCGPAVKALSPAAVARQRALIAQPVKKSADVAVSFRQITADVAKKLGPMAKSAELDEERRLVTGIASVSTVDGQMIEDYEGDFITTRALEDFCHDLIRGTRGGAFDHADELHNEVVEAMVFSEDLQKSLGIDLGMEFLLIRTHVPADDHWADVKDGVWMQSIRGTMFYEDAS
jgi:hypothetical protein